MFSILDGGNGSCLGRDHPDLMWQPFAAQLEPEKLRNTHKKFVEAGADIITTFTYGVNPDSVRRTLLLAKSQDRRMMIKSLGGDAKNGPCAHEILDRISSSTETVDKLIEQIIFAATRVAKFEGIMIAGSISLGDSYDPSPCTQGWSAVYKSMAESFRQAGADVVLLETVSSMDAIEAMLPLLQNPPLPIWVSLSVKDGYLLDGAPLLKVLDKLSGLPALTLANCCSMEAALRFCEIAKEHGVSFGCYPNAATDETEADHTPFRFEDAVQEWFPVETSDSDDTEKDSSMSGVTFADACQGYVNVGASVIGGCCQITPNDIRQLFDLRVDLNGR